MSYRRRAGPRASNCKSKKDVVKVKGLDYATFEPTEPIKNDSIPEPEIMVTQMMDNHAVLNPFDALDLYVDEEEESDTNVLKGPFPLEIPVKDGYLVQSNYIVSQVNSLRDIRVRSTRFQKELQELENCMSEWYTHSNSQPFRMMDILNNGYYAAEIILPNAQKFTWARVKVVDDVPVNSEIRMIKIVVIDHGIRAEVHLHQLARLLPRFREYLPQLGLRSELKLRRFSKKISYKNFTAKLKEYLIFGKIVELKKGTLQIQDEKQPLSKISGVFYHGGILLQEYVESLC